MSFPLFPAELAFAGDGTVFSPRYGDIYHSSQGGLEQARHVFLAGNGLPARWKDARQFVILETGFGLGLNFLVTLQAWRNLPTGADRCLHYVAIEKHPFLLGDLKQLHRRWPQLAALAAELHAQWPLPLPGLHRLALGDAVLTLGFGDAAEMLPQMELAANAIYLDGFAPDRNPDLWSDHAIGHVRRLAAPGATFATWTTAGEVRRRLAGADFSVERRPGFGAKREMLIGSLPSASTVAQPQPQRIAVIGAGLAGASTAHALAARGHAVTVLESATTPAAGASGNLAGVFRPLPAPEDGALARLLRAGFLLGRRRFSSLQGVRAGWTGVLHVARDPRHEETQRRVVTEHQLPAEFCRFVSRDEASVLAGWPVAHGGWWFADAGWINPPSLCHALLDGLDCRFGFAVRRLEHSDGNWLAVADGDRIEVDGVVLANGIGAMALVPELALPIRPGRGLVSHVDASATPPLDIVVTRLGYVTPPVDGLRCAGATSAIVDVAATSTALPLPAEHAENLYRLEMMLPGFGEGLDLAAMDGRVSFRPMSPDRLPIVGPLLGHENLWICDGFGARGLVFAAVCAELLASQICREPLPIERDLVQAVGPARFLQPGKMRRSPDA